MLVIEFCRPKPIRFTSVFL